MTSPTLEVAELRDLYAAFEAVGDFADVVLEAAQRFEFAFEDDAPSRRMRTFALRSELAALHVAAGDRADLGDLEDLANFGAAEDDLAELRREHADHRFLADRSRRRR